MKYLRLHPHPSLQKLIDCYWIMENDDSEPKREKIIPDGYTELIFHYGDVFRSNIMGTWQTQSHNLIAGQISNYFWLENTGQTGLIAVKFKPAALRQWFGLQMNEYTNRVSFITPERNGQFMELRDNLLPFTNEQEAKERLDNWFLNQVHTASENPLDNVLQQIFSTNGLISVSEMAQTVGIGERQLQRLFRNYIGLAPKYYARIIRFNYIFQLMQAKSTTWSDIIYQSGYYDQSHFIRDFKAFTGEDPSSYYFEEKNMANFFLNR